MAASRGFIYQSERLPKHSDAILGCRWIKGLMDRWSARTIYPKSNVSVLKKTKRSAQFLYFINITKLLMNFAFERCQKIPNEYFQKVLDYPKIIFKSLNFMHFTTQTPKTFLTFTQLNTGNQIDEPDRFFTLDCINKTDSKTPVHKVS